VKSSSKLKMADIQSKVQEELVRTKKDLIKKAKAVKLDKDNRTRTYIHARRLWNEFGKYQKAGKYDLAFYCLHLYLRVVLEVNYVYVYIHPYLYNILYYIWLNYLMKISEQASSQGRV